MVKVYKSYDQAGLDAEYNLRRRFPDFQGYFDAWARDGAAAKAKLGGKLDLAYGPTPAETLDFFPAAGARSGARAPLLVVIHGGYWQFLDKADMDFLAPGFVEAGIAFASLNYALAPRVSIGEIVRQIRAAIAWLWRAAPGLGCDSRRIFVAGHSAGGHLTAMAMATDWPRLGGLPADLVKGGLSISGVYDLEPIRLSYQNPASKLDRSAAKRLSPINLPPPRQGRFLVTIGGDETAEFHRQQAGFTAAWQAKGQRVEAIPAPGLHHFDILAKFADPGHAIGRAALDLVGVAKPAMHPAAEQSV